ncbi:MAG TPA: bifunctional 4-hydroxy-2-oxoglutarate aldolase/2-dehydro-3-deoxy-phosphogluconate aldolase [Candidatus Limnocylindrales bacterium]
MLTARLIGIVRLDDVEMAVAAAGCAIAAGLEVVEITFTMPGAARAIERLRKDHPGTLVGAGTVRTQAELQEAVGAGAQFLVAPGLNPTLLESAQRRGLAMLPGVFTASEIDLALRLGAEVLKLFPAEPSGPEYLAAMLQPFPAARLVPTGGVSAQNASAYLRAGAAALAMGSSVFPARRIKAEGPDVVTPLVRQALAAVRQVD